MTDAPWQGDASSLVEAFRKGEPSPLPELPVHYADYAAWQRRWLDGEVLDKQLGYWTEALRGAPQALDLPLDHPRPQSPSHRGGRRAFALSPELSASLHALARKENVTLFMLLLAAFDVLLHRYTGQGSVLVGSPVAGRGQRETEGLIGFFVNTLVLRCDLSGDPDVLTLMRRLRGAVEDALRNQQVPFDRVVSTLGASRGQDLNPLVRTSFVLENAPFPELAFPGLVSTLLMENVHGGVQGTAKFELGLVMIESMACGTPVVATRIWGTPEVVASPAAGVLAELKRRGIRAGILSNGDPEMLGVAVRSAGFADLLQHVISVHTVQRFKTDPAAYALGPQTLKLPAREILFVSSNGWDAIGATWFGYTTLWVNRAGLPLEQLDTEPTRIGSSLREVLDFFAA